MHIQIDEALQLLTDWKNQQTPLQIHISRPGVREDFRGTLKSVEEARVEVTADQKTLEFDIRSADFNGDGKFPGYLVCEFTDGRRYSFYVLRGNVSSFP